MENSAQQRLQDKEKLLITSYIPIIQKVIKITYLFAIIYEKQIL